MYLTLLIIGLGFLVVWNYRMLGKDLANPALHFSIGFLICSINLSFFRDLWDVQIKETTFLLVLLGNIFLSLASFFYYLSFNKKNNNYFLFEDIKIISVTRLKIFFLIQVLDYLIVIKYMTSFYGYASLAQNLVSHTNEIKSAEGGLAMQLPFGVGFINSVVEKAGVFFAFLFPFYCRTGNKYNNHKRWLGLNLFLWLIASLLSSGRSPMLSEIISAIIFYLMALKVNNIKIKIKQIFFIVALGFSFLASFQQIGYLVGRNESDLNFMYDAVVYCGAEIQNLNDLIEKGVTIKLNDQLGVQTFYSFYSQYSSLKYNLKNYHPFNIRHGYPLGNVSSCFQAYFDDFGFGGCLLICALLGIVMQFLYMKALYSYKAWSSGVVTIPIFLFGVLSPSMFLSFFSESFFVHIAEMVYWKYWLKYLIVFFLIYGNFNKRFLKGFSLRKKRVVI